MSKKRRKSVPVEARKTNGTKCGVIRGWDVMRASRGYTRPAFRSGRYMTKKDRPREKISRNNIRKYI